MRVKGKHYRTIWLDEGKQPKLNVIDQKYLPHEFRIATIRNTDEIAFAIKEMQVRGAGLIGATAAYGMYLGTIEAFNTNDFDTSLKKISEKLLATRPTAVNLAWAINKQMKAIRSQNSLQAKIEIAKKTAHQIADEDAENCKKIGEFGLEIIENICKKKNSNQIHILTHCNAGWLAFVDYGTALSPIYTAAKKGIDVHVWVDETRPRNQGAALTAWELEQEEIPHTLITDNAGGHLMQHDMVDLVLVGSDRTTANGDVANKIGTYLKALAAKDNNVPFYVALPSSTIDWKINNGLEEIKIEERSPDEVKYIEGLYKGEIIKTLISPINTSAVNYGFDVTPNKYISGLITERGICLANKEEMLKLFPEQV